MLLITRPSLLHSIFIDCNIIEISMDLIRFFQDGKLKETSQYCIFDLRIQLLFPINSLFLLYFLSSSLKLSEGFQFTNIS